MEVTFAKEYSAILKDLLHHSGSTPRETTFFNMRYNPLLWEAGNLVRRWAFQPVPCLGKH